MNATLNPVQKYLLRLVMFGAGKTIFHKDAICEVIETHNQIRRLFPLIDGDLKEAKETPFWVPRTPANRKDMKRERIRYQYANKTRNVFSVPHFVGEPRPNGIAVTPQTLTANPNSSGELTSTLGKSIPRRLLGNWRGFHLVPVPKGEPMKTQNFFSRKSVERGLQKMTRTDSVKKVALMEIVFYRQSPRAVSRTYAFPVPSLEVQASRLRKLIRDENPNAFAT